MTWKSQTLMETSQDFEFLSGPALVTMTVTELQKSAFNLASKYNKDLDGLEISAEIESFQFFIESIPSNLKSATPLDLCQIIHDYSLTACYPNIETALNIFLTLPVTVASCKRSFSKLKLIKNYLRPTMGQDGLSNLSILSIEYATAKEINFDSVIDDFASMKARKVSL